MYMCLKSTYKYDKLEISAKMWFVAETYSPGDSKQCHFRHVTGFAFTGRVQLDYAVFQLNLFIWLIHRLRLVRVQQRHGLIPDVAATVIAFHGTIAVRGRLIRSRSILYAVIAITPGVRCGRLIVILVWWRCGCFNNMIVAHRRGAL